MHAFNASYLHFYLSSDSKTVLHFSLNKQTRDLKPIHLASMQKVSIGKYPVRAQAVFPARNEPPTKWE